MRHPLLLFLRSDLTTPVLTTAYPTTLRDGESIYYDGGGYRTFAVSVFAKRGAGGDPVTVKLQGAVAPPGSADFAVRANGGKGLMQGLLSIASLTSDFDEVILEQRTGINQNFAHTLTNLDSGGRLLTLKLQSDANGGPAATPVSAAAYITANLPSDFAATASGDGSVLGLLGSTLLTRAAPRALWVDIPSDRNGTVQVEHTITAAAGNSLAAILLVTQPSLSAFRALGKSAGTPAAGDSVQVLVEQEGG